MKSSYVKIELFVIIFLITNAFEGQDAACPTAENSSRYRFGVNCEFLCHCKRVDERCNETTGECTQSGCGNSWMGPGCQYRNIVSGQKVRHSDNLSKGKLMYSGRATDDRNDTCSMTAETNSTTAVQRQYFPFWKVWFPTREIVKRITFLTMKGKKEFLIGFQIFVENTTLNRWRDNMYIPKQSSLCYEHTETESMSISSEVVCYSPLIGNQVRLTMPNRTSQIILCDFRIYGGRDLAFHRRTDQSSNYTAFYASRKAADGAVSSPNYCSLTKNEQNPWWNVDFGYNINIQTIRIFEFSAHVNIAKMNIYTAESDVDEWVLLQHYQQSTTNNVTAVVLTSLINARKLMISTNLTGKLGFCEVQVFGDCPSNQCGWNCEKTCHCRPPLSPADSTAGVCTDGCEGRWVSTSDEHNYCDKECANNKWGTSCFNVCGNCKDGAACDVSEGACPNGCDMGYRNTARCNTKCSSGKYGSNCSKDCSGHCTGKNNLNCNQIDGSCRDGCEAGWTGSVCDQECSAGKYGVNCSKNCSGHCKGNNSSYCHRVNGSCEEGCKDGWNGLTCDKECSSGTYGSNCSKNCSGHCIGKRSNCDHVDGICQGGCEAGWAGLICDQGCSAGKYGVNCLKDCSGHCKGNNSSYCQRIDGSCEEGCKDGWNGLTCSKACSRGKYGVNCSKDCSGHCLGNDSSNCDHIDGTCQGGCKTGWEGSNCDKECSQGFYGANCRFSCSGNCLNGEPCDKQSGSCISGCQDDYTGARCAEKVLRLSGEDDDSSSTSSAGGIAGGVVAAAVIITTVVLPLFFLRRRRQLNGHKSKTSISNTAYDYAFNDVTDAADVADSQYANAGYKGVSEVKSSSPKTFFSEFSEESAVFETDNEPTEYMNTTDEALEHPLLPEHAIYISDLGNYIQRKTMSDFEEEFQTLPSGSQFSTADSLKSENRGKNRYKGLYPYDKTRVQLQIVEGSPGSDYINASCINGYNQRPIYIAAQGPTDANVNDFWRMIYELKIRKIVMVTSCVEDGKMKCIKYWPDDEAVFGLLTVSLSAEEIFSDCIIRHLTLKQENENKHHEITQFYYTAWPDHGTPANISSLVHFWQKVRKGETIRSQTWVIHCSAGIGRTGTFIGLDYLYDEGKAKKYINVYKCVESMRDQRINMVQRKEQYKFLHEVVYEVLCSTNDPIPNEEFASEFHGLMERDIDTNKPYILSEYKQMNAWTFHKYSENGTAKISDFDDIKDEFSVARLNVNASKSRYQDILPPDDYRPILSTSEPECEDYINAVYIPMFKNSKGFIITQNPLPSTIVDFYRMIYEKDVKVIVSFDDEASSEAIAPPQGSQLEIGPFLVDLKEEVAGRTYITRTLQLTSSDEGSSKQFQQYIFKIWNQQQTIPTDVDAFMNFLGEIERIHLQDEFRPTVVKCLNGATKSGLFCVVWNVLERMRIDGEVAIPQTIRNLRHRRQQIIPNFDQYSFCYEAVHRHIKGSTIYANMQICDN